MLFTLQTCPFKLSELTELNGSNPFTSQPLYLQKARLIEALVEKGILVKSFQFDSANELTQTFYHLNA